MVKPTLKRRAARDVADAYLGDNRPDADLWRFAGMRGGHALSPTGDVAGWIVTYKQKRARGESPGWQAVVGLRVFVDGQTGEARLLRT